MKSPQNGSEVTAAVAARQEIEKQIVEAFLDEALKAGYSITVDDGEGGEFISQSQDKAAIVKTLYQMDEDVIWIHGTEGGPSWMKAVYGNDGWDVISDYCTDIEPLMKGKVRELQDHYS